MSEGFGLSSPPAEAKAKVGQTDEVRVSAEMNPFDAAVEELRLGRARLGTKVRIQGLNGDYLNYQEVHFTPGSSNSRVYGSFPFFCQ